MARTRLSLSQFVDYATTRGHGRLQIVAKSIGGGGFDYYRPATHGILATCRDRLPLAQVFNDMLRKYPRRGAACIQAIGSFAEWWEPQSSAASYRRLRSRLVVRGLTPAPERSSRILRTRGARCAPILDAGLDFPLLCVRGTHSKGESDGPRTPSPLGRGQDADRSLGGHLNRKWRQPRGLGVVWL